MATFTRNLKREMVGDDVRAVKDKLVELGYLAKATHNRYGNVFIVVLGLVVDVVQLGAIKNMVQWVNVIKISVGCTGRAVQLMFIIGINIMS